MKLPLFRLSFPTTFALAVAGAFSVGACTSGVASTAPIASTGNSGIVSPLPDAAPSALDPSPLDADAAVALADCSRGGSAALDSGPVDPTKIDASGLPIEDAGPSVPYDASGDPTRIDAGEISARRRRQR
jgi:hypothetical protein